MTNPQPLNSYLSGISHFPPQDAPRGHLEVARGVDDDRRLAAELQRNDEPPHSMQGRASCLASSDTGVRLSAAAFATILATREFPVYRTGKLGVGTGVERSACSWTYCDPIAVEGAIGGKLSVLTGICISDTRPRSFRNSAIHNSI